MAEPKIHVTVTPAYLGWSNPESDGTSLRLYATDKGNAPRWSNDSPTGRTAEVACAEDGAREGERYLVVRLGSRFITDEQVADATANVERAVRAAFGDGRRAADSDVPVTPAEAAPTEAAQPPRVEPRTFRADSGDLATEGRCVFRQVGWRGQTGAFYPDETAARAGEPGGYSPVYVQVIPE